MQGVLFWKYVVMFVAVMSFALVANSLIEIWFTYREHRAGLFRIQREQANAAADKISQFVTEIEGQLGWTTHLSWSTPAMSQRELDGLRLLRQVPAITELAMIDDHGREQLRYSRQAMDRIGGNADVSGTPSFTAAIANKVYYGPVYFRRETEPYMTLSVAGVRRETGVTVAEVNLTHIWDVVHQIRVGETGRAYVVDAEGRLIAHPDISLVLRNTDLSRLAQVKAARASAGNAEIERTQVAFDLHGQRVLTAHAPALPLNWFVFVELPEAEANRSLYAAVSRSVLIVMAGLLVAIFAAVILARRMVIPIHDLTAGARRFGKGALDHRIDIRTGDELEVLGAQFNLMAGQLQGSYADLERKVDERTHQLQAANLAKSRFLAAASHDLRQPLHALNLFVAQLRTEQDPREQKRLALRIDSAVANMNELFNALLDISKLDSGALEANVTTFSIDTVLKHIETTFGATAADKGLHFRVVNSTAMVRSDPILLERIVLNLVSNAVRYTATGGVVIGCRHVGSTLRLDVCDTGIGIAGDQQRRIFNEFYQVASGAEARNDGLGLGLAIVDRLSGLLRHQVSVESNIGSGSRFSVTVPKALAFDQPNEIATPRLVIAEPLRNKVIVVIDDDPLVLDSTRGLLTSWGCQVLAAQSARVAIQSIDGHQVDLIISDFSLLDGLTGIDAIKAVRNAQRNEVPAFLISGDISSERRQSANASGFQLLHKPVNPMSLRAMISRLLITS